MQLYGSMKINDENNLEIAGVDSLKLIEKYGTPLLVFDESEIRNNIKECREGLNSYSGSSQILYASKAFANRTLYRILLDENINLDVVSGGELYTALSADFPTDKIFFHGNNKLPSEIKMGLDNNIAGFFIDNVQEAALLEKMAKKRNKKLRVFLRLKPGLTAHTHEFILTGNDDSKFGVSIKSGKAMSLVRKIINEYSHLELTGIHAHIGSQIYEKKAFLKLIEIMTSFMKEVKDKTGYLLNDLDLGGGYGISQTEDDPDISIKKLLEEMIVVIERECKRKNIPLPNFMIEPGRSIVGTAGTTLYKIGMIKEIEGIKKYITIDGGMTDNIRPALYGSQYSAFLANRCNEKPSEVVTIAGKCCESGDILIRNLELPPAVTGDILAVPCTGAYTYALSSNYNGIPRPAIVMVSGGEDYLIKRRENYDELLKGDIIPEKYKGGLK